MQRQSRLLRAVLLACSTLGCGDSAGGPTQLVVVVEAEHTPDAELHEIVLRVSSRPDRRVRVVARNDGADAPGGALPRVTLPFSFGIAAPEDGSYSNVKIDVEGLNPDGKTIARARARVGFVPHQSRTLTLSLTRACDVVFAACREAQTCRNAECVDAAVDARTLPNPPHGSETAVVTMAERPARKDEPTAAEHQPHESCQQNGGYFADVGRELTRTLDLELCPVASVNEEWGGVELSREQNTSRVQEYLARSLEVQADVLLLNVAVVEGTLTAFGVPRSEALRAANMPTLQDALATPGLREADQPVALLLEDRMHTDLDAIAVQLADTIATAGIAGDCRPVYLIAQGATAFDALRKLRALIHTDANYMKLRNVLHFGLTIYAPDPEVMDTWMDRAQTQGFDLVRFDRLHPRLPLALELARRAGLAVSLFNTHSNEAGPALCGLASMIEHWVFPDRPAAQRWVDEGRGFAQSSQLLFQLDLGSQHESSPELRYRMYPEVHLEQAVELGSGETDRPTLVHDVQAGTLLSFAAERTQRLVVPGSTVSLQWALEGTARQPEIAIAMLARFRSIAYGERGVLLASGDADNGWAIEYVGSEMGPALRFVQRARAENASEARERSVTALSQRADLEYDTDHFIYVRATRSFVELVVDQAYPPAVSDVAWDTPVAEFGPITLGAAAGAEGGWFSGELQKVRIVAMH